MTTSPRHLVILWDYYQHYHYARLAALEREAAAQGWRVTGLAAGLGGAARDSHLSSQAPPGSAPVLLGGAESDLYTRATVDALTRTLDELQPTAVILPGYGSPVARAAVRWCRRHRRGAVMIIESQERDQARRWWKEWIKRRVVRAADTVFCGGITHADYAAKLGMARDRIFPGYSAVDNRSWAAAAAGARAQPSPARGPYFVAVGRFIAKKNFAGLIEAFASFKRTPGHQTWQLALVGAGPERPALESALRTHGLEGDVLLPGYADLEETARWLAHAAAFVLPSAQAEQWGLVVNEAMACGLPVVVSQVCGCVEDLVEDGRTGYRFDPGNNDRLAEILVELADDGALRDRLGAAARVRVEAFSLDHFARQAFHAALRAVDHAATR